MTGPANSRDTVALTAPGPDAPSPDIAVTVSAEAVAWFVVIALAAVLRFAALDRLPFTLGEAERALEAVRVADGSAPLGWSGDLAAALTAHLFRLSGEGELAARAAPAVAGTLLVAALLLARPLIGRLGALVAAALVAASPLFILVSRSALPFSAGALVAAVMVVSLFLYLRRPAPLPAFLFAVAFALAPLTDAVAVSAAVAVVAYLALEGVLFRGRAVRDAVRAFVRSPSHWLPAVIVLAAAVQLGLTHFGTTTAGPGLPGLEQWLDMFDWPRDGREPEYQALLLFAYDWPLLLAGCAGLVWLAACCVGAGLRGVSPFQRFLLLWLGSAAAMTALAAQREAGQLLMLLLPLSLLAGTWAEDALSALGWSVLRRWWPLVAGPLALIAYAALVLTRWSAPGDVEWGERAGLVLALGAAAAVLAGAHALMSRRAWPLVLTVSGFVVAAFLAHSSLAVSLEDGVEPAADERLQPRAEQFAQTLEMLGLERGGDIVVDEALAGPLAWPLRDSTAVFRPGAEGASAFVTFADRSPAGFSPLGGTWRLVEGWYPRDIDPLLLWRWLVYRRPYGNLHSIEVRIFVPTL